MTTRYDDVIPIVLANVEKHLAESAPQSLTLLRDIFGRVTVLLHGIESETSSALGKGLTEQLGSYASDYQVILDSASSLAKAAVSSGNGLWRVEIYPSGKAVTVQTIDRRVVGQDWLTPPSPENKPLRLTFASLKGGVGRSTALSVTAAHLAQSGYDVLVVDLDLEAPGLGSMLLQESDCPSMGVLDYLVENGRGGVSDAELDDYVATSELTDRISGQGIVDVAPAMGTSCRHHPQNVLGKIARALVEDPLPSGGVETVRSQVHSLIDRLSKRRNYDVILVDARAGLGELTATALLGTGGSILLFGVDQPQTFEGYSYLLSHLAQLPHAKENDWRYNIKFVQAKAPASVGERQPFKDALYDLTSDLFYEAEEANQADQFSFGIDDPEAPHSAWWIGFDGQFLNFDPIRDRAYLNQEVYRAGFGEFLKQVDSELELNSEPSHQASR